MQELRMKTVGVKFQNQGKCFSGKEYAYNTFLDVEVEDLCVVDVDGVYQVVKVTNLHANPEVATKCIISRVDLEQYRRHIAIQEKLCKVKKAMDARVKELKDTVLYEQLAATDPMMRELLSEYKSMIL